jgi:CRISPR-associated protein Cas2
MRPLMRPAAEFVVVAYDVASHKRRRRVADILGEVGVRVQKSVFECFVTHRLREELARRVEAELGRRDRVAYYGLCEACRARAGRGPKRYDSPVV